MKLTCVTAVYNAIASGNRERLIRCVESVSKIAIEHEHLIYDGGSKDGTVELLNELGTRVVGMRWRSEPDTGIYNALNKGVRDARGEWFYVLGCDDYIERPAVLERQIARLAPSVELSVSPVKKEYDDGVRPIGFELRNLFFGMPYCHQGVLIRTSLARAFGGFDERYRISADYDMMLKCHQKAVKICYEKERFAVFYSGGVSGLAHEKFGDGISIMQEHFNLPSRIAEDFKRTLSLPLHIVVPFLLHRDPTMRAAAVYMIARRALWLLKCLMPRMGRG